MAFDDGRLVIGASQGAGDDHICRGTVHIYKRHCDRWELEARLSAVDGHKFGASVALAGEFLAVGAPGSDLGAGAVFWAAPDDCATAGSGLGHALALDDSGGGPRLIASGLYASFDAQWTGAAFEFVKNSSDQWRFSNDVIMAKEKSRVFGFSIAVEHDVFVAGNLGFNGCPGSAIVYEQREGVWWFKARLYPTNDGESDFGRALAIWQGRIGIGSPDARDNGPESGAAYIFAKDGPWWVLERRLVPPDGQTGDRFGTTVAWRSFVTAIGAPYADGVYRDSGEVYLFSRNDDLHHEQQAILSSSSGEAHAHLGISVGLEPTWVDGAPVETIGCLAGAPHDGFGATGAVHHFEVVLE